MKKFIKITGYCLLTVLVLLYLAFLFVLPKKIDLNTYKPNIQKLVKENTDLNIDFDKVDVITTPLLEAGIKTKNITVKLPDNSVLFSAESFKGKVFLPSLLWLSVRVTSAEIESPKLNVEIVNSEKYKVAKVYEDLVNKKREQRRQGLLPEEVKQNSMPFDISDIKLYIPSVKLNNYKAVIDDTKAEHKLTLKGEQIKLGYFNGKNCKLKADAKLYSDKNKNITANFDIDSFVPTFRQKDKVDDIDAVYEIPFVNPVSTYRDYNLKSDINSKIKIRRGKNDDKLWAKGNINIENTTVTLSGLELPKSYFKLLAKGTTFDIDTNIYATDKEYLNMLGTVSTGKNPYVDLKFKSSKVHFNNLLKIARAYLDTIHIKNDVENMTASGYLYSNFRLKTDFKTLESAGNFIIRDGNIYDKNIGLLFEKIKANIILDNNILLVKDTSALINSHPMKISGTIGADSVTNINIFADKIPLMGLYKAFAPRNIKDSYDLNNGILTVDTKIQGEIKNTVAMIKAELQDFNLTDKNKQIQLTNKIAKFGFAASSEKIRGKFTNKGFNFVLNKTKSKISNELLTVNLDNSKAVLNDSIVKFNNKSLITLKGQVDSYLSSPDTKLVADGYLNNEDLKILAGEALAPYLDSKGSIPVKAEVRSKGNRTRLSLQMQADADSYVTPVSIDELNGKTVLFNLFADKKDNNLKVHRSGIFIRRANAEFMDNYIFNLVGAKEIVGLKAVITNMHRKPFLSLFRISVPNDLSGTICAFPYSKFYAGGSLSAYGDISSPTINGRFNISQVEIPQWLVKINDIAIDIMNKNVKIAIKDIDANDSDINVDMLTNFDYLSKMKFESVNIRSNRLDVEKIMKVTDGITSSLPNADNNKSDNSAKAAQSSEFPIEIARGFINFRRITSGKIVIKDTTGRLSLNDGILYINKLKTNLFDGKSEGDVAVNLLNQEIKAKLTGKEFDVEKMLSEAANMKDTLSGTMNFIADLSFKASSPEEQMKSMKGYIDFNIKDGQLGPFGKFENFLMAENIRENAFFSSAIGSIITNVVTFDTSRYNELFGHLTFSDGFVNISPIKSQGNVMSIYLSGKVGLLDNSADMILRGKLGSAFSDKLGPLANINPVNLVKNTPGLNIVLAKTFSIFCEAVSEAEMKALPPLAEGKSDDYATKFQIKLRGDTRKPLKMIKSFKWLALNSEIESAKDFVDTMPVPEPGEEGMSVEELVKLRQQQAEIQQQQEKANKSLFGKIKNVFKKSEEK